MGCNVGVNMVTQLPQFRVHNLPAEEVRRIYNTMEQQSVRLEPHLKRNLAVWFAELDRVRRRSQQAVEKADVGSPITCRTWLRAVVATGTHPLHRLGAPLHLVRRLNGSGNIVLQSRRSGGIPPIHHSVGRPL